VLGVSWGGKFEIPLDRPPSPSIAKKIEPFERRLAEVLSMLDELRDEIDGAELASRFAVPVDDHFLDFRSSQVLHMGTLAPASLNTIARMRREGQAGLKKAQLLGQVRIVRGDVGLAVQKIRDILEHFTASKDEFDEEG